MRRAAAMITCVAMLCAPAAMAEEANPLIEPVDANASKIGVHLYAENDGQAFKWNSTDRWYTSGVRIAITASPDWTDCLARATDWLPLGGDPLTRRDGVGVAIGHKIFTPVNLRRDPPKPTDRPYAGWLYGGFYYDRATDTQFDRFEVDLGVVGPSALGETFQHGIHEVAGGEESKGWGAQLHDEFGFNIIYTRKWKIALDADKPHPGDGFAAELIPSAGFVLGMMNRQLDGDLTLRLGWNLPDDFGPGRVDDPASATASWSDELGVYGYVRVAGHVVEHDAFIQGNNYHSSAGVEKERLYGEVQFGVMLHWKCIAFGYAQTYTTDQFEHQSSSHSYGMYTLTVVLNF